MGTRKVLITANAPPVNTDEIAEILARYITHGDAARYCNTLMDQKQNKPPDRAGSDG